jgi:predicted PurR-regulated permease PerM
MMETFNKLPRWLVWEIAIPLTLLNGWLLFKVYQAFQTPCTILITATLLAFLLSYPIAKLEQRGIRKEVGIGLIVLVTLTVMGVLGVILLPILLQQLNDLATRLPAWLESGGQQFQAIDTWLSDQDISLDLTALVEQLAQILPDELVQLPDRALEIVLGLADRLVEVLTIAILTLYLILHGDNFWTGLIGWLPGNFSERIRPAFQQQFRNYFVGQATISVVMATTLTTLFFLFKIPYWLVFGMSIGLLALFPFGDTIGILTAAIIVSFKSVVLGGELIVISLVTDQVIDNVVAPKILGDLIGLNPVWILIALLLGAQLGGFLGLVLAVPLAGTIKRILTTPIPLPGSIALDDKT